VKDLEPHLRQLGFDLKVFGRNTVVIEGIPADVKPGSEQKILTDVLEDFKANEHASVIDVRDRLAKSFACKAAIKAGDPLNAQEMTVLIEQLFLTNMPYVCPHGRPVVIRIPVEDRPVGKTCLSTASASRSKDPIIQGVDKARAGHSGQPQSACQQ